MTTLGPQPQMSLSSDDMELALERHATSKLPDEAIEQVATLGFRGEALPSIGSVSRMRLTSCAAGLDFKLNPGRAGIERVLDQFLDDSRRALDNLAGCDLVDQL